MSLPGLLTTRKISSPTGAAKLQCKLELLGYRQKYVISGVSARAIDAAEFAAPAFSVHSGKRSS
jgi:hypothetical protein